MKIEKIDKQYIKFNENINCLNFNIDTPLLINTSYECVLGNSLRNHRKECVDVIFVDIFNQFEKNILFEFENDLANVLDQSKKYEIEKQINDYLRKVSSNIEVLSLFDIDDLYDTRTINDKNYNKPCEYNYKKNKKKEIIENESLFGVYGDEF